MFDYCSGKDTSWLTYLTQEFLEHEEIHNVGYFDVYTWPDATFKELNDLFREGKPDSDLDFTKISKIYHIFKIETKVKKREYSGSKYFSKTLKDIKFIQGDIFEIKTLKANDSNDVANKNSNEINNENNNDNKSDSNSNYN